MPYKPRRPCSYPGCPRLTNERFCDEHKTKVSKAEGMSDSRRLHRQRYGLKWKRIRDRFISKHPLCEKCKEQGRLTPAEEVHHILPLSCGGTNDEENLMSLCKSCHSEITAYDKNTKNKRYFN